MQSQTQHNPGDQFKWTEDRIEELRQFWSAGKTANEIARLMGTSRNSIVGKAHRLDLEERPSPIRRRTLDEIQALAISDARKTITGPTLPLLDSVPVEPVVQPVLKPVSRAPKSAPVFRMLAAPKPPIAIAYPVRAVSSPVPTMTPEPEQQPIRRRTSAECCWPIGEPGTKAFRYCDNVSITGKPYCIQHAKIAYVRLRYRDNDAA